MKKLMLKIVALILFAPAAALAQYTSVTATVASPNSTVWANASYQITFVPYIIGTISKLNGSDFTQSFSGTLNGSGQLSVSLADNGLVTPANSQWRFYLCMAVGTPCFQKQITITGTSMDISTQLNASAPNPSNNVVPNPSPGTAAIKPFPSNQAGLVVVGNNPQTAPLAIFADHTGSLGFAITPTCLIFPDGTCQSTAAAGGLLSGSGTTNYITKWTGTHILGNSDATDDGTTFSILDNFFTANGTITNLTSTNATITNLTVTNINGNPPANGTVTSINVQGDGTVENTSLSGCPVTTSGTCTMSLVPANAGYVLAGPLASAGSNVSFRQSFTCVSSGTTATCPITGVNSGDALVLLPMPTSSGGWFFGFTSDTLGTTFTQYGGASNGHRAVGFTIAGGSDTLTVSGGTIASGLPILILDLAGASTYNDTNSAVNIASNIGGVPFSISNTVTALAATDAYINVGASNGTCYGGWQASPVSTLLLNWAPAGGQSTGIVTLNAPGNTSSISYSATATTHTGSCHNDFTFWSLDFSQSASASAAPPLYRRLTEGDLPASAISAIQSVQTFTIASPVALPSATTTTALSGTVTMPSQGCPCRINVQAGIFLSSTTSATWGWWVTDGTNTFGDGGSITTDLHTPPLTISRISPVSYANNQTVTISLDINPGTYAGGNTVQALSTYASNPDKSSMTLTVMQSRN